MTSRSRILLLVVAALALAGGAYYVLAIYLPRQEYIPAQAEIARWEDRLAAVRECLLGPKPGSPKLREALAVYQLSIKDPWRDRTPCARRIGALSRGETEDTGLPAVEDAWEKLEAATIALAKAYVEYVDPLTSDKAPPPRDPLEAAFARLDAAHTALRTAAKLPAPAGLAAIPPLAAAEVIPLRTGSDRVTWISTPMSMSHANVAARTARRDVWLALAPGAAPVTSIAAPEVVPSANGARWGAITDEAGVVIGPLDESGLPPLGGAERGRHVLPMPGESKVLAVIGTADDGLALVEADKIVGKVLGEVDTSLIVARSRAGKLTADQPIDNVTMVHHAIDPGHRMLVSYTNSDDELVAFIADGAAPAQEFRAGAMSAGRVCLTAARGWIADYRTRRAMILDGTGLRPAKAEGALLGCNERNALFEVARSRYQVCAETCRDVAVPEAASTARFVLSGDRIVGASARDGVLAVWREQAPIAFYALDQPRRILFALSDGKVVDLITQSNDGIAIVRIPAA